MLNPARDVYGLRAALREAGVAMTAALATLACTLPLAAGTGSLVLAVVLSLSLSRSHLDRDWRHRLESAVILPVVGVAAIGVGWLLRHEPPYGAAVFVAAMASSIWLRRFGTTMRRMGSLIVLPFIALLVTPPMDAHPAGGIPAQLVPVLIGLLALLCAGTLQAAARAVGFLPSAGPVAVRVPPAADRESTLKPDATTRMSMQMAIALGAAFAVGFGIFAERWTWIVLTTYIVLSGNRGRLDVAYKSVLRIAGAAAGSAVALVASARVGAHPMVLTTLILVSVFLGVWLRTISYAWWALFITVALGLLQGFGDGPVARLLLLRIEEILIGGAIGVATAWFVLPVRSGGVVRRRLADALAALSEALDPAVPRRTPEAFLARLDALEQLAPPFRASRRVFRHAAPPADWIDALLACRASAAALIESGKTPALVRRAIGTARKSLRDPAALTTAMEEVRSALESSDLEDRPGKTSTAATNAGM